MFVCSCFSTSYLHKKKINSSKCKLMHFGNDISYSYAILDLNDQKCKMLKFITEEKDHKLNFSHR